MGTDNEALELVAGGVICIVIGLVGIGTSAVGLGVVLFQLYLI